MEGLVNVIRRADEDARITQMEQWIMGARMCAKRIVEEQCILVASEGYLAEFEMGLQAAAILKATTLFMRREILQFFGLDPRNLDYLFEHFYGDCSEEIKAKLNSTINTATLPDATIQFRLSVPMSCYARLFHSTYYLHKYGHELIEVCAGLVRQIIYAILGKSLSDPSDDQQGAGLMWKRVGSGKWVIELPNRIDIILAGSSSHWKWDEQSIQDTASSSSGSEDEEEDEGGFEEHELKAREEGYIWKKQNDGRWCAYTTCVSLNPCT